MGLERSGSVGSEIEKEGGEVGDEGSVVWMKRYCPHFITGWKFGGRRGESKLECLVAELAERGGLEEDVGS
jgi:hypothetical protein